MNQDIISFEAALRKFNIYSKELVDDFTSLILEEGCPADYYDFIGNGAYKEVYNLAGTHAIKFALSSNQTSKELDILAAAEETNIDAIFLPTACIHLSSCLRPAEIGYDEEDAWAWNSDQQTYVEDLDYEGEFFTDVFIQPLVSKLGYDKNKTWLTDENFNPILLCDYPPEDFHRLGLYNYAWIVAVAEYYGKEFLNDFVNFCINNNIHDLHNGNLAYMEDGRPVIIDWLS